MGTAFQIGLQHANRRLEPRQALQRIFSIPSLALPVLLLQGTWWLTNDLAGHSQALLSGLEVVLRISHAPHIQRLYGRLHVYACLQLPLLAPQLLGQLLKVLQPLQHLCH